jgi:Uma2 family endonuclease
MPRDRRCRLTMGDVRVQVSDDVRGIYAPLPDVMVWCGPMEPARNFVTTPLIVVEVLSPSSMDNDRGAKLRLYKTGFQTLRQIVLVYQDQMRVETYERVDTGWDLLTLSRPEQTLMFSALVFGMTLADVHGGVAWPSG